MLDKTSFMEVLHEVMELVGTSGKPVSREELKVYFKDMELNAEQEELVYQYLLKGQRGQDAVIAEGTLKEAGDKGTHNKTEADKRMHNKVASDEESVQEAELSPVVQELRQSEQKQKEAEKAFLNAPYVKMYLKDIRSIKRLKQEELFPYYERLLAGEDDAADVVLHNYLHRVVAIAKRYVLLKVNMEDVVQEGNMGLLLAVKKLKGKGEQKNIKKYIENEIKKSMENYINQTLEDDNWEQMVLGRARLLQDAREALAKELLRVPSISELSEYTHLSEEEINDISSLIKEKRER
ncbi:MAG: hypothetical protein J6D02_13150 [Lachnospira sp.]|nr:hypothetical protein [Lachnospira sp.]